MRPTGTETNNKHPAWAGWRSGLWALLIATPLISGCATPIKAEFDEGVNFQEYRTFAWSAPDRRQIKDPILDSGLLDRRMGHAVRETLKARGFEEVAADEADFLVTYHTTTRERLSGGSSVRVHIASGHRYPYHPHWYGPRYYAVAPFHDDRRSYQEGTLMIDIVDRERQELIWRGWRAGEVRQDRFRDDRLRQQVERILGDFPPSRANR